MWGVLEVACVRGLPRGTVGWEETMATLPYPTWHFLRSSLVATF